jgi:hypothetical protein
MYVIRNRKTKEILLMLNSVPGEERDPKELYPDFDPKKMEFGRSEGGGIPAWFSIEKGKVVEEEPPAPTGKGAAREAEAPRLPPLTEQKAASIEHLSRLAIERRRELIPDYQLDNVALGLYDEKKSAAIRATVQAFRDEFHRLESEIEKARSAKALQEIKPNFPKRVSAAKKGAAAAKTKDK